MSSKRTSIKWSEQEDSILKSNRKLTTINELVNFLSTLGFKRTPAAVKSRLRVLGLTSSRDRSPKLVNDVLNLRNEGYRVREIADKCDISFSTVNSILYGSTSDVSLINRRRKLLNIKESNRTYKRWTDADTDKLQKMLLSGKTRSEIAKLLKCTERQITNKVIGLGKSTSCINTEHKTNAVTTKKIKANQKLTESKNKAKLIISKALEYRKNTIKEVELLKAKAKQILKAARVEAKLIKKRAKNG